MDSSYNGKKVLIITYYWPPSGGSGVQRWLKITKYLPQYGWTPIIYTPSNPEVPNIDETLLSDINIQTIVLKTPIWLPYSLFRWMFRKKKSERMGTAGFSQENKMAKWKRKLAFFLRGNLCVPDPKIFWKKKSVEYLTQYLEQNPVEAIVSTGPPHSMHLIALALHKKFGITWLADFRDPWTKIDYYNQLSLLPFIDRIYKNQEKRVLSNADIVVAVTNSCGRDFQNLGGREVEIVMNGYDAEDFKLPPIPLRKQFTFFYMGVLFPARNNTLFWEVLSEKIREEEKFRDDFRIEFVGRIDIRTLEEIKSLGLSDHLINHGYLPHKNALECLLASHHPLLISSPAFGEPNALPGKVFEYIATRKPILALDEIGGEVEQLIKEHSVGYFVNYLDKQQIRSTIDILYKRYLNHEYDLNNLETTKLFTRNAQAQQIAELLNKSLIGRQGVDV